MRSGSSEFEAFLQKEEVLHVISDTSEAEKKRLNFSPPVCPVFSSGPTMLEQEPSYVFNIHPAAAEKLPAIIDYPVSRVVPAVDNVKSYKRKRRIGIVFSGGPAPGGHNVIAGLYDAMKSANPENELYGFILGPDGILENNYVKIDGEMVDSHRNLGGFSMIKTGRTKIDTEEKIDQCRQTCRKLGLDALVIVGGDDSNTNAAFLAQALHNDGIQVIGVPKTIDGDIQVRDANGKVLCAISFGFHTAARAFAQNISNLCNDGSSDVKYWHVCKVMGRVASHLALEVALQVHPNICLIGEEIAEYIDNERIQKARQMGTIDYTAYGMTLRNVSRLICDGIVRRAASGKNYGIIVIPEGLLEFINEIQVFIIKLNTIIAEYNTTHDTDFHSDFPTLDDKLDYLRRMARLSREENTFSLWNTRDDDLFNDIPAFFQEGLLMERDSHGNFPFSQVQTEKVIMGLVKDYLKILEEKGLYKIGIERGMYEQTMKKGGLDPDQFGLVLFKNFNSNDRFLIVRESIVSKKTLAQELEKKGVIGKGQKIPEPIKKIYKESVPKFKTQFHFYGYDGRGNDPTWFDATYGYNLGQTVFSLVANNATGLMAAIRNLEKDFSDWEPLGIPIAPLMHLEERKGRLSLVIERSIVDIESPAFKTFAAMREKWLAAHPGKDRFRRPGPITLNDHENETRPITLLLNNLGSGL